MHVVLRHAVVVASLAGCLALQPLHAQQSGEAATPPPAEETPVTSELQRITDSGTLRVGVNPEFMPFSFVGEGGERVGVDIDIAGRLAEALGVELEVIAPETFAELIPSLVDERVDLLIAGMSITFERARTVNFTDPYFDTGIAVMMNIGTAAKLGIAEARDSAALLDALRNEGSEGRLRIAVTEGKAPAREAERRFPEATITGYPTNEEAAQALSDGKADLMIHDEIFLKVWLQQNAAMARHRLIVLDPPIKPDYYGIAVRQGDPDWLAALDVFVRELRADRAVIGYLGEYLPSLNVTESPEQVIPLYELGDME